MGPKYIKRQKVRIVSAKNQHFKPRYPQLDKDGSRLKAVPEDALEAIE